MILRCRSCHGTVWMPASQPTGEPQPAVCRGCGQQYRLDAAVRTREQRLFDDSRSYAQQHAIDLPSAYSVLLGIMTLDEVRELGGGESAPSDATPEVPTEAPRDRRHDPAFAPAVEAGLLTARQAMERGNRETYAGLLVKRHDLPIEAAYRVADNRISLLEALRQRDASSREPLPVTVGAHLGRKAAWTGAAMLLCALGLMLFHVTSDKPPSTAEVVSQKVGAVDVLLDATGRVVQVLGPNPRDVLRAYCGAAVPDRRFEVVDLVLAPQPGSRLGLFRDPADVSKLLSVTIQEDAQGQRWVVGDGRNPVVPSPAPPSAQAAVHERR